MLSNSAFNSSLLKDFVYPIPICQPETDLGSILHIFHYSNCQVLAIPLKNQSWGIIDSRDLVSFLGEACLREKSALVAHPRNISYQQSIPHLSNRDFNSIVRPATVLQADSKLDEFFDCLESEFIFDQQNEYLIVDATGELQGQIDRNKVIRYLASKVKQPSINTSHNRSSFSSLSDLGSLMDSVTLPLKVQTASGKDLYLNQYWQEISTDKQNLLSADQLETEIASWWLKQQDKDFSELPLNSSTLAPHSDSTAKRSSADPTFYESNYESNQNQQSKELSPLLHSQSSIEIEPGLDWNYLKVPLTAEKQFLGQDEPCYLILATKIPLTSSPEFGTVDSSKAVTTANNFLATVSHELKSPVTAIVGLSSLLKGQKLGNLNQRQARYVKLIHQSGKKMMGIVDDLLGLSSLAAQPATEPELINLELLCRQLCQQILTKIQATDTVDFQVGVCLAQLKLNVELGTEMAIANKLPLSLALTHLIWETIRLCEPEASLEIKINSFLEETAISISGNIIKHSASLLISDSPPSLDSGLNLVIAQYLASLMQGSITSEHSVDRRQFTLLLPKNASNSDRQLSVNPAANPTSIEKAKHNLTILCLYPELNVIDPQTHHRYGSNFDLKSWSENSEQQVDCQHRIIEADSLEQAHNLARIWHLDIIILDGYQIIQPKAYLRSLQASEHLSALPLITLDTRTTEAANQIEGLNVYPCLLPVKHRNVEDLMQVIKIATKAG
jgi:hypothetical protein